jgi:HTH-type transcriptional regulator/antitoxin HigA
MDIRLIRDEFDYDWALAQIVRHFEREPATGTADAARFDALAALIQAYEARHWPIEAADATSNMTPSSSLFAPPILRQNR